jgi:formylglycine-generating enzyme required for sulfatase activity
MDARRSCWWLSFVMGGCSFTPLLSTSVDRTRDVPVTDVVSDGSAVDTALDGSSPDDAGTSGDAGAADGAVAPSDAPVVCPAGTRLVPAGDFMMGSEMFADEQPIHAVRLSAFCMDETEVTVAAYAECVTATTCGAPPSNQLSAWGRPGEEQRPVAVVEWAQARDYCRWRGGDLPTEAQWEYAARGTDGRRYPWGNASPGLQPCWQGPSPPPVPLRPCDVATHPDDRSPFGILDMGGNIGEWTRDWYAAYSTDGGSPQVDPTGPAMGATRVVRGGDWTSTRAIDVGASYRRAEGPARGQWYVGFRCIRPGT